MKIGILTYHYGYNEGTLLQAYAVQTLIDRHFGIGTAEIVDHRYPEKEAIVFKSPITPRDEQLRTFFDEKLHQGSFRARGHDLVETWSHVADEYDLVVVGSDELWRLDYTTRRKFLFSAREQANPWAPAFPNVYWPDAAQLGVPCVSLAASISEKDRVVDIPKAHRRQMRQILQNLSLVTVRDSRTESFVREIAAPATIDCQWLPDPTFGLDPHFPEASATAMGLLKSAGMRDDGTKRALVVSHSSGRALAHTIGRLKNGGYQIVSLSHPQPGVDIDLSGAPLGPLEWGSIAGHFDLVVTDRFHGAVFALRNGTPVLALDYRDQLSGRDSKMLDLFKRFGLEDFWYRGQSDDLARLDAAIARVVDGPWPVERVGAICRDFSDALQAFVCGPVRKLIENSGGPRRNKLRNLTPNLNPTA